MVRQMIEMGTSPTSMWDSPDTRTSHDFTMSCSVAVNIVAANINTACKEIFNREGRQEKRKQKTERRKRDINSA